MLPQHTEGGPGERSQEGGVSRVLQLHGAPARQVATVLAVRKAGACQDGCLGNVGEHQEGGGRSS